MLSEALQSELEGKRIFITGGTGIFGRWLIQGLDALKCELVLLSRNPTAFRDSLINIAASNLSFIEGDIRSFDYPEGRFDYIIHAATPVVTDSLDDDDLSSVIIEGTRRVLDFALHCKCQRLLYVSSGAVYGRQSPNLEQIPETFPCAPTTVYGKCKLISEKLCLNSGVNCVIARCFSFVGQGMPFDAHFAIGNFIGNCLRNETIVINGDGSPLRSYMDGTDLVEWLITMMIRGVNGEVYNVGSDVSISIADLAHKVRHLASTNNQIEVRMPVDPSELPERYVPCNKKAKQELSLKVKVDLDSSICGLLKPD